MICRLCKKSVSAKGGNTSIIAANVHHLALGPDYLSEQDSTGSQLLYAGRAAGSHYNEKEEERTISVYKNSHNTLTTLLGHSVDEHTCMGLSMKLD